jgi:hypothetical protein
MRRLNPPPFSRLLPSDQHLITDQTRDCNLEASERTQDLPESWILSLAVSNSYKINFLSAIPNRSNEQVSLKRGLPSPRRASYTPVRCLRRLTSLQQKRPLLLRLLTCEGKPSRCSTKQAAGSHWLGSKAGSQAKPYPLPCSRERTDLCNTRDIGGKVQRHTYLLSQNCCQMVPAMRTVVTSNFRYSAPLVP